MAQPFDQLRKANALRSCDGSLSFSRCPTLDSRLLPLSFGKSGIAEYVPSLPNSRREASAGNTTRSQEPPTKEEEEIDDKVDRPADWRAINKGVELWGQGREGGGSTVERWSEVGMPWLVESGGRQGTLAW